MCKNCRGVDLCHEIKRCLLLWRKAMTNLDSILKSKDITLPSKWLVPSSCLVKAMVFPVVMYRYGSWTIKKADHQRIEAFKPWCFKRVPWTASRSNKSVLKESILNIHWKDWCWSLSSNTLAPMWRAKSSEKTLILGKIESKGEEGSGGWDG